VLAGFLGLLALGLLRTGWLGFLRELTLYWFLPVPCLIAAALLLHARVALALALAPSLLFAYWYGSQLLPVARGSSGAASFRAMTFNAGGQEGGGQLAPLLRSIRVEGADMITLQEVPPATLGPLSAALVADYPYQVGTPDAVTISRFPILDPIFFRLQEDGYLCQRMDVVVEDRLITLFNVHVRRPSSGVDVRRNWLPWASRYDVHWRDVQLAALLDQTRGVDGPLVVMGDFNQTEWSPSYLALTAELEDGFRATGWGFGHTYPTRWGRWPISLPLLRIDYILHSPELVAARARVGQDGGSYHLPVVADLAFRQTHTGDRQRPRGDSTDSQLGLNGD
jgi:endonuclease/exonuclease/phosphatase (EEP) superfamily protein YafD